MFLEVDRSFHIPGMNDRAASIVMTSNWMLLGSTVWQDISIHQRISLIQVLEQVAKQLHLRSTNITHVFSISLEN